MGDQGLNLDKQRVFFSELHDDNPLDCITEKKTVIRLPSEVRSMMPPLLSANKILLHPALRTLMALSFSVYYYAD
jgi:hypothetical protein